MRSTLWVPIGLALLVSGCESDPQPPPGSLPPLPDTQTCTFAGTPPGFVPPGDPSAFGALAADGPVVALHADDADLAAALTASGILYELPRGGTSTVLLDLSASVEIAYDFARSGPDLFVAYTPAGRPELFRVSRFPGGSGTFDPAAGRTVIDLSTPNGGTLAIAEGNMLFVGVGDVDDDGLESEAFNRDDLRGKILRLDVTDPDAVGGYAIPPDNPIRSDTTVTPIFALGVRAPRFLTIDESRGGVMSFVDQGLVADEINTLAPGRNYGWPRLDGRSCHRAPVDCSPFEYEGPTFLRARGEDGCAMIAGAVIGPAGGAYAAGVFYGDGCGTTLSGFLFGGYRVHAQVVGELAAPLAAIGRGAAGGALAVDAAGSVVEVTARPDPNVFPVSLRDAGCFADLPSVIPLDSVVPYDLNAPLFTDGSYKQRFIAIPAGTAIAATADGSLEFPVGSVLLKVFSYGRPLETRVLVLREDGWEAHTYRYNDDASDALLLDGSDEAIVDVELPSGPATATHLFPDRQGCAICHGFRPQEPLGPRLDQLERQVELVSGPADQLEAMDAIGLFGAGGLPDVAPMPDPLDASVSLEMRARAYLHTNCGHCHQPGGWVPADLAMDLRFGTAFGETATCDIPSDYAPSPIDRLEPGDPDQSLIYLRMTSVGVERMPPLGTSLLDTEGSAVVRDWITSLASCE